MKKLFTVLTLGVAGAVAAMAAPGLPEVSSKTLIASPEMQVAMKENMKKLQDVNLPEGEYSFGSKKVYVTATDIYTLTFATTPGSNKITDWWKFTMNDGSDATFEKLPMYVVECAISRVDRATGAQTAFCDLLSTWPSYRLWGYDEKFADNYEIVSMSDMADSEQLGYCNTFAYTDATDNNVLYDYDSDADVVTNWCIWSNALSDQLQQVFNSQVALLDAPAPGKLTQYQVQGYDPEDQNLEVPFSVFFKYGANVNTLNLKGLMVENYSGPGRVMGFDAYKYDLKLGDVHVIDLGPLVAADLMGIQDPYDLEWDKVHKFMFAAAGELLDIVIDKSVTTYQESAIQLDWKSDTPEDKKVTDNVNNLIGPMFAPYENPEFEYPYGCYWMERTDDMFYDEMIEEYLPNITPRDYTLIPWGMSTEYSKRDGFEFVKGGYYVQWRATEERGGTLTLGSDHGIDLIAFDVFGNEYHVNYDKDIIYHYDSKNIQLTKNIPSKGVVPVSVKNLAADKFAVRVVNGKIVVNSESDNNVAVYNLSGAAVANRAVKAGEQVEIAANKGIYVVKVGKTAKKVVL